MPSVPKGLRKGALLRTLEKRLLRLEQGLKAKSIPEAALDPSIERAAASSGYFLRKTA